LTGSSWLQLPWPLHWLTGNIGFHHVHHLNPRIPNYRLAAAHAAMQRVHPVQGLSLAAGLKAPWLTLWDETSGRLVRFSDVDLEAGRRGPRAKARVHADLDQGHGANGG
jgi:acyl-lipid omega-6 desaturase (Delta-12 desaturase)